MTTNKKVVIIGLGNIGQAVANDLVKSRVFEYANEKKKLITY